MIVQFMNKTTGTPIYINPEYVVAVRPEPESPLDASLVKLNDGEEIHVIGDHMEVADKLRPVSAVI